MKQTIVAKRDTSSIITGPGKILVDASCLASPQRSGIGNYTENCIAALIDLLPNTKIEIFLGTGWTETVPHSTKPNGRKLDLSAPGWLRNFATHIPGIRLLWRIVCGLQFVRRSRNAAADAILAMNYLPPGPCESPVPVVYDVSFVRMPQFHPAGRVAMLRKLRKIVDNAPAIVTISEFSRREIAEVYGMDQERIFVAYPGLGAEFHPLPDAERRTVLRRHGLEDRRYFLAIGNLEPRKNLKTLMEAYANLPDSLRRKYPLVIGGGGGWGDWTGSSERYKALHRSGQLRLLGYVAAADLPALYGGATAFCFPSFYEGFGMPVIEAMGCDTVVLASNAASIPEAAGDAGVMIHPGDTDAWTAAMQRAVDDDDAAAQLRSKGLRQAARFTWTACAKGIVEALQYAAQNNKTKAESAKTI